VKTAFLRKHATTIALSVLAAGAATWVLVDRGSITTAEAEKRKKNLIPAWRGDEVTFLSVELPGKQYSLERDGADDKLGWTLVLGSERIPADDQAVFKLLGTFEYAEFQREVPAASIDRTAFGLDDPAARFDVKMGSLEYKLAIGGATPASKDQAYAEIDGRVFVVSTALVEALSADPDGLRARDVVPYLSTDLASLTLEGQGGTRKFDRALWSGGRGSGFKFGEGSEGAVGRRVDGARLDQVFLAFGRMQAESFIDPDAAKAASHADVTVTMVPKTGKPGVLIIGGDCPGKDGLVVVRRTEPTELDVCVPKGVVAALSLPASDFIDDGLIGATVDEITEVSISDGGNDFDLVRNEKGFKLRKPEEHDVPLEVGTKFLEGIVASRGEAIDLATPPAAPTTTIKIWSQGGIDDQGNVAERTEEIELGSKEGDRFVAVRREDGEHLSLGADAALAFASAHLLLMDRHVVSFKSGNVASMEITGPDGAQELGRDGSNYVLQKPQGAGLVADQAFTTELVDALSGLTAERFVADHADASMLLDPPRTKITIAFDPVTSQDDPVTILFGAATDDGPYAMIQGKPGVFIAPETTANLASRWLVSRASFAIAPSELDAVEIEVGAKTLSLTRDGSRLVVTGHPQDTAATDVTEALGSIDALLAVSVGAPRADQGFAAPTLQMTLTPRRRSSDAAPPKAVHFSFGTTDTLNGDGVRYARRADVDATFAVPAGSVKRLAEAAGGQ